MNIKTKFNIGDKAWFYIEEYNQYAWGKIQSIHLNVNMDKKHFDTYVVDNRHFDENYFMSWSSRPGESSIKTCPAFNFPSDKIFLTAQELKHSLNQKHADKMVRMAELKKRWFQ